MTKLSIVMPVFNEAATILTAMARVLDVDYPCATEIVILDADLEYSPADIPAMLEPVLSGISDHVFGVRVFGLNTRYPSFRFAMGGRATTLAANILYDSCLTDMHTCLKLVPIAHFRALQLSETGFGLDTELTARLLRAGVRPYEVPVSYNGRNVAEGKKITWRDGVRCLAVLGKVRAERSQTTLEPVWAPTPVRTLDGDGHTGLEAPTVLTERRRVV